jgi:hypothetical protein
LDFAEVSEEVLAAAVRRDEAEALAVVEPLHDTGLRRHLNFLSRLLRSTCCRSADAGQDESPIKKSNDHHRGGTRQTLSQKTVLLKSTQLM